MRGLVIPLLAFAASASSQDGKLLIPTSSGTVLGTVNTSFPNVNQYLGIPYAQPPIGALRFLPPQPLAPSSSTINATNMPPACPQTKDTTSPFFQYVPETLPLGSFSEDCLNLNVYTPSNATAISNLPVIIWIYGGAFVQGSLDTPAWNPAPWVQTSQAHIVVAVQYRLNIFGFPGAARALADQNLGILDQRRAVEWARDNVAAFGGDPERMVLWGQSAGAGSVDVHNFAFAEDPVVAGFMCDSGSALLTVDTRSTDAAGGNFSAVARGLGCATEVPADELDCMRGKPFEEIVEYLSGPGANFTFVPFIDDKVVFGNYTDRLIQGAVSRKPAVFGSNLNEGTSLVGVDSPAVGEVTKRFQCQAPYLTPLRERLGLKTWRYQYRGNFSNVSPEPKLGAYHCAELPLVFGTSGEFRGQDTEFEGEVGRKMQDLWVRFAEDSEAGLDGAWQNAASGKVLKIGEGAVVEEVEVDGVDEGCEEVYASFRG